MIGFFWVKHAANEVVDLTKIWQYCIELKIKKKRYQLAIRNGERRSVYRIIFYEYNASSEGTVICKTPTGHFHVLMLVRVRASPSLNDWRSGKEIMDSCHEDLYGRAVLG